MDSSTIDLPNSEIESVKIENGRLTISFSRVIIIKTMSGSSERTRWYQSGDLIFEEAELESSIPECPCICEGGDVGENVYTYRDMIPLPLESQGRARCDLKIKDQEPLQAWAEGVKLAMKERPRYIEHLRDTD
ncbi:hypothetical protein A3194_01845 [Candidatus Thiodiazotropha endoloripes]|uniref:hypothetical protein n=1 Tax=Candidatus Thiodiazotropha endoloripes TaxID=1818881 RepID=UPI00083E3FD5|nr:hypothetical protein [Candidatus Thiodiazotropha endoloripes]ODB94252.1 hypothetical protein A3194_01845 [Candidatus Thiodiazotropha endoloripes]